MPLTWIEVECPLCGKFGHLGYDAEQPRLMSTVVEMFDLATDRERLPSRYQLCPSCREGHEEK